MAICHRDTDACAFTVGNHVAFNDGEYDPSSEEGQHVLAHELAHVRQQTGGAVSMLPQEGELRIDPDEQLEREAEETAQQVMRGGEIGVHRMRKSEIHVQRSTDDGGSMTYEGMENLTERVNKLASELADTQDTVSSLSDSVESNRQTLEEEVQSGWSDMMSAAVGGGIATGGIAGGRAAAEPEVEAALRDGVNVADVGGAIQDTIMQIAADPEMALEGLGHLATDPQVAGSLLAAGGIGLAVHGGTEVAKNSADTVSEKLSDIKDASKSLIGKHTRFFGDDTGDGDTKF